MTKLLKNLAAKTSPRIVFQDLYVITIHYDIGFVLPCPYPYTFC